MGLGPSRQEKIMVIEDDANLNKLIVYNLSKSGYKVDSVYDGTSAREKLAHEQFDVVILDIMLPGIDGFRLCEAIKTDPVTRSTFVVVLTARAEPLDKIYGTMMGADCYLTKPFSVAKLLEMITKFFDAKNKGLLSGTKGPCDNDGNQDDAGDQDS